MAICDPTYRTRSIRTAALLSHHASDVQREDICSVDDTKVSVQLGPEGKLAIEPWPQNVLPLFLLREGRNASIPAVELSHVPTLMSLIASHHSRPVQAPAARDG